MEKQLYFTAPVEAVRVTVANLDEVAEWCGGKVCHVERESEPGAFDRYVWVPTPKGSTVYAAYPGMIVTMRRSMNTKGAVKVTCSVFYRDYFEKNYFVNPVDAISVLWPKTVNEVFAAGPVGSVSPGST